MKSRERRGEIAIEQKEKCRYFEKYNRLKNGEKEEPRASSGDPRYRPSNWRRLERISHFDLFLLTNIFFKFKKNKPIIKRN